MYECVYCGKSNFQTQRGLDQHLQRAAYCRRQHSREEGDEIGYYTAEEGMAYTSIVNQAKVNRARQESIQRVKKQVAMEQQVICTFTNSWPNTQPQRHPISHVFLAPKEQILLYIQAKNMLLLEMPKQT